MRLAAFATAAALMHTSHAYLECRQPNYLAKGGKLWAVDPADETVETEIQIKGVAWRGMEQINMIPDGLWGTESNNSKGTQATTVSTLMDFLSTNDFNSVRLALNAEYVYANPDPQISYIHAYENPELTTWDDPNNVDFINFLGRLVETLQDRKLSVLLDLHLLTKYSQDAYWYTNPFVTVTESGAYKAATFLAHNLCGARYWNILGIDLKDEMLNVEWNGDDADSDEKSDWRAAAGEIADAVLELCPQWLVFVGGASSPTDAQRFKVSDDYEELSDHWNGGNLKNATINPLNVTTENKVVYAPHAHAHGVYPRNYFLSTDSNCSTDLDQYEFDTKQSETQCLDLIDGELTESLLSCTDSGFGCSSYSHLSTSDIESNYKAVMAEALGDLVSSEDATLVLGAFSGVYGAAQPHQTAALDYLIDFAASEQGGYFYALNPDTQMYLEDSADGESGTFAVTHYGLMKTTSWQEPYEELLAALERMPSSEIPCYGGKEPDTSDAARLGPLSSTASAALTSVFVVALLTMVV